MGSRPDYRQVGGSQPYIDAIGEAGDVGVGKAGRFAKQDLIAAREGRIEEMGRLRPVISAINARTASDYTTGRRQMSKDLAFGVDPMLSASLDSELTGRLNENAGVQYAQAAGGAYNDAEQTFEGARRFRDDLKYRSAVDQAGAYQRSLYDATRKGGLFSADTIGRGVAAFAGAAGSALSSGVPRRGPSSSYPMGDGQAPGEWV